MREVKHIREGSADHDAPQGKGREGSGRGGVGGAAAGSGVNTGESSRLENSDAPKDKQRITEGKGRGDEQDLRSLKRSEEKVLSVTR